jgi:hypothetical protein
MHLKCHGQHLFLGVATFAPVDYHLGLGTGTAGRGRTDILQGENLDS